MGCHRWIVVCCFLVVSHLQGMDQLEITRVDVPASVKVGEDFVVLDCVYELGNTSTRGLVVKWFLNNYDLVYQWIYNTRPQAIEPALKYIDLEYKASEDPSGMYRAMKLRQPDVDLTGNYTCQISTFEDEVSQTRAMTVYATGDEEDFKLWHVKTSYDGNDGVEVTCQALGVYPKPTLDISIEGLPNLKAPRPQLTESLDGHYDIVSHLSLVDKELPDSVVVNCVLGIPSVNYTMEKKLVHYPAGRRATTAMPVIVGGTTKLLRKMEIQAALDHTQADASSGGVNSASPIKVSSVMILLNIAVFAFLH